MKPPNKGVISGEIRRSQFPPEYKTLMYILLDHVNTKGPPMLVGLAWPDVRTLSTETRMTEAQCQAMLDTLAFLRVLTVEHTPKDPVAKYRFNVPRLAASDPIAALMLRDKLWRIPGLNSDEHVVLDVFARYAVVGDFVKTRVSWKLMKSEIPWLEKNQWHWILKKLRDAGVVSNVGGGVNQHSSLHLLIHPSAVKSHLTAKEVESRAVESHLTAEEVAVKSHLTAKGRAVKSHSTAKSAHIDDRARNTPIEHTQALNTLSLSSPLPARTRGEGGESESSVFWERLRSLDRGSARKLQGFRRLEARTVGHWHESQADQLLVDYYELLDDQRFDDPIGVLFRRYERLMDDDWDFTEAADVERLMTTEEREASERAQQEEYEARQTQREADLQEALGDAGQPQLGDAGQLWAAVLGQLQMQVTKPNFDTWLKYTSGVAWTERGFQVGCPNAFAAEMIEQRMYSLVAQTLQGVLECEVEVEFIVNSELRQDDEVRSVSKSMFDREGSTDTSDAEDESETMAGGQPDTSETVAERDAEPIGEVHTRQVGGPTSPRYIQDPELADFFDDTGDLTVLVEWDENARGFFVLCSECGLWDRTSRLRRVANHEARLHRRMHESEKNRP